MKKNLLIVVLSCAMNLTASEPKGVKISERFGYDPVDSTAILQKALDSGEPVLILDKAKGPWVSRTLRVRNDTELLFEDGAELVAKRGEFKGSNDMLLHCYSVTNIVIRGLGKKGGTVRMWKKDYQDPKQYKKAEWRHCLRLGGAVNVTLENMTFASSGGDGICIGMGKGRNSKNIVIRRVTCDDNHRQGISACCFVNLLMEDCVLSNTRGTPPQAGLDVEPDRWWQRSSGLVLKNVLSIDNAGNGFEIVQHHMRGCSFPTLASFENCRAVRCRNGLAVIGNHVRELDVVRGAVSFSNCSFESNSLHGIEIQGVPSDSMSVRFDGCRVVESPKSRSSAVQLTSIGPMQGFPGDVKFNGLRVERKTGCDWFRFTGGGTGPLPDGVRGNVTVVGTNGVVETVALDDGWRKKHFRSVADGVKSLMPLKRQVFARIKAVDTMPGELVDLADVGMTSYARTYLVLIERPGKAVFHARQRETGWAKATDKKATVYRLSERADEIYSPDHRRKIGEIPVPLKGSGEMSFNFGKPGLYAISFPSTGCPVVLEKSNVPVAIDLSDWLSSLSAEKNKPFTLWFHVPSKRRFSVVAGHNAHYGFKAEVFRPDGSLYDSGDNTASVLYLCDVPEERSAAGLWSVRFSKTGSKEFTIVKLGLGGLPPVVFLSDRKYWVASE